VLTPKLMFNITQI